jgi:hypothetical protein
MVGKNPLWVAKQHGHSVTTMFRVYTAWAKGALDADIQAIKRAMKRRPAPAPDPEWRRPTEPQTDQPAGPPSTEGSRGPVAADHAAA